MNTNIGYRSTSFTLTEKVRYKHKHIRNKHETMQSNNSGEPNRTVPNRTEPNQTKQPTREERGKEDPSGYERDGSHDVHEEHAQAGGHSLPSARLLHEEGDEPVERRGQADGQRKPRHSNGKSTKPSKGAEG